VQRKCLRCAGRAGRHAAERQRSSSDAGNRGGGAGALELDCTWVKVRGRSGCVLVTGFSSDNGPQRMLIQLLPSSTVATGVRLKMGFGTVASAMPGGTDQPDAPNSGGVREPSQYWLAKFGFEVVLFKLLA